MSIVKAEIRPAIASDGEAMARLFLRVWHITLRDIVPSGFLDQFQHDKVKFKYANRAVEPNQNGFFL